MVDTAEVEGVGFACGRLVKLSTDVEVMENISSLAPTSSTGSNLSLWGEGTSPIFTGADDPSNQAANPPDLRFVGDCARSCTTNSSASAGVTLSGDKDRVLPGRKKEKAEDLVGDEDCVRVKRGGRSTEVLER